MFPCIVHVLQICFIMRIDKIELENFRCFEHLKMECNPRLNVLVGANASGKTALIYALRRCLGTFVGQFSDIDNAEKQKIMHIAPEDVRFTNYGEFAPKTSFSCSVLHEKKRYKWKREKSGRNRKTTSKDTKDVDTWVKELEEQLKHPTRTFDLILPLVAYFSTDRVSAERKFTTKDMLFSSRVRGYFNALGHFTNTEYLKEWFKNRQLEQYQHATQKLPSLELMKNVIKQIPGVEDIEYIIAPSDGSAESDLYLSFTGGRKVGFQYLSDGQKMLVSMLTDTAMRCLLLNPQKGMKANETPGVVLIDEVELHLHPAWQRLVIPTLLDAFPQVQFFITTHSPQVLSEVPKESVFILNNYRIENIGVFTEGRDSNSILKDVFGISPRPVDDQQLLNRFYHLLEEKNHDDASKILSELEKKWGELDSEIVRANLYFQDLMDEVH